MVWAQALNVPWSGHAHDPVALMVFAHQMQIMNLLAHPDNIDELVDYLLFADEPALPGPIRGNLGLVSRKICRRRTARPPGPFAAGFRLERRLMRYPCSYMIYTEAFDGLPSQVNEAVYRRMWRILSGEVTAAKYERFALTDRKAVLEIPRDTKKELPDYFQRAAGR